MHYDSAVGHIGGNLSCLDTLIIIFNKFFLENDRFILSKGHSAGALYVSLWSIGILNDKDLLELERNSQNNINFIRKIKIKIYINFIYMINLLTRKLFD